MVSLEKRLKYLERILENIKLNVFYSFLFEKEITFTLGYKNQGTEEEFVKIVVSLQENDEISFKEIYSKKSRSKPEKNSQLPFVNDDYLLFCFLIGVARFNLEKAWLNHIFSIRTRNPVTITLENILTKNYFSKSNVPEIVLVYFKFNDPSLISDDVLNNAYQSVSNNPGLFDEKNDFRILSALRAYDLVIERKEAPDGSKIALLQEFEKTFAKRIMVLSLVVNFLVLFALLYFILKMPEYSPGIVELIDKYDYVFTLIGALGISLIGNQIPFFKNLSKRLIMKMFGYPRDLQNNKIR